MFIQTEDTPNPLTLKFLPGQVILQGESVEFTNLEEARRSPLAYQLFLIQGVQGVFYGSNFVTVSRAEGSDWAILKPQILGAMIEFFLSGQPLFVASDDNLEDLCVAEDDPIVRQIRELLDLRIRPAVAMDGGDITFVKFEDGIVYVRLKGACAGCPSSTATLKAGIENTLRHYIPEVQEVRQT